MGGKKRKSKRKREEKANSFLVFQRIGFLTKHSTHRALERERGAKKKETGLVMRYTRDMMREKEEKPS